MPFDPQRHHRRSIRLRGHDYRAGGGYFLTICTMGKECFFGNVVNGETRLNEVGGIVERAWKGIPAHFPNVELYAFVVMPNHIHGVLFLGESEEGKACLAPTREAVTPMGAFGKPMAGSLAAIVGAFKSASAKAVNELRGTSEAGVWQRNYHERVIRTEMMLDAVRLYIECNPANWSKDSENPLL